MTRQIILESLTTDERALFEQFLSGLEQSQQELVSTQAARRVKRADALGQLERFGRERGIRCWYGRVRDDQAD